MVVSGYECVIVKECMCVVVMAVCALERVCESLGALLS